MNRGNGVVRFSFLPMHAHPELLDGLSPDVLKRKTRRVAVRVHVGRRRDGRGAGGAAGARVRRLLAWRRSRCLNSDPLALMRRYLDAVNAGDLDAMAAMTGPGYVHHSGAGDLDMDGVRRGLTYYRTAFPDLVYDVEEMLVVDGGNAVVARWTIRGDA